MSGRKQEILRPCNVTYNQKRGEGRRGDGIIDKVKGKKPVQREVLCRGEELRKEKPKTSKSECYKEKTGITKI